MPMIEVGSVYMLGKASLKHKKPVSGVWRRQILEEGKANGRNSDEEW
jgi:hypothetical protein